MELEIKEAQDEKENINVMIEFENKKVALLTCNFSNWAS